MLALCTVILLSQYPDKIVKLPNYSLPTTKSGRRLSRYKRLDPLVDKCITLSCGRPPRQLVGGWPLALTDDHDKRKEGSMDRPRDFQPR
jgi:hypothetical protein